MGTKHVEDYIQRTPFMKEKPNLFGIMDSEMHQEITGDNKESNLISLLKQSQAPEVDLEVFSGNPVDFIYFMTVFKQVVEDNIDNSQGSVLLNTHKEMQEN